MAKKKNDSLLLPLVVGLLFACAFAFFYLNSASTPVNPVTGCAATPKQSSSALSILLDSTEPYSPIQMARVTDRIIEKVSELEPLDRVRIYKVDDVSNGLLQPYFDFCKPDPNANASPIVARFKQANFAFMLEENLKEMQGTRSNSPIISSISSIAVDLPKSFESRSIVLVSDLIENSDLISMYDYNWRKELVLAQRRLNAKRPMLNGITLEVLFIPRPNRPQQDTALRDWWWQFIEESGGRISRFTPVSG